MTATSELRILVSLKDEASKGLKNVEGAAGGLKRALGDIGKIAGGFVLAQGIMKAPGFLMDAAQAAADDAASIAKLQKAVENSGKAWSNYKGKLEEVTKAAMKRGFTDDEIRDSLSLLTAQTDDVDEATRRFALAQDLARGANIDVYTASKLLGKVTEENVNVLARYGIKVAEGTSETELFGKIQAKFGGQAETFAKSTAGQMAAAKIQMSELKEELGYAVLPVMTKLVDIVVNRLVPGVQELAAEWGPKLQPLFQQTAHDIGILRDAFVAFGGWLVDHKEALVAALLAIGVAFVWANPVGGIALGIVGIAGAIEILRTDVEKMPRPLLELRLGILEVLEPTLKVIETLTDFSAILLWVPGPLGAIANAVTGFHDNLENLADEGLASVNQNLKDTRARLGELDVSDALTQFQALGKWTDEATKSSGSLISMTDLMNPAFGRVDTSKTVSQLDDICTAASDARGEVDLLIKSLANTAITRVKEFLGQFGPQQSLVPGYQMGGVIPGPLGRPQLALVHGGEEVLPAGRSRSTINNRVEIHVNVQGDGEDIETRVFKGLDRALRRAGFGGSSIPGGAFVPS